MVHPRVSTLVSLVSLVGREREATEAARALWDDLPPEVLANVGPFIDVVMCSIYDAQKRFGRWEEILAEPAPPEYLPVTTAVWRAHRAVAFAALKDFESAEREHDVFRAAVEAIPENATQNTYKTAMKFLAVSDLFIEGEIAL